MLTFDITNYGHYRLGLTSDEINEYLRTRTRKKNITILRQKFNKVAGVTTMALGPEGQILMYRHDVQRFTNVVLLNKPTYFD